MDLTTLPEDLTSDEKTALANFVANGCPGLVKINDDKVFKWFELYMTGKSYGEIAELTKDKKELIMYVGCRSRWLEKRMEYYHDMSTAFANKIKKAKLESANTIVTAISALGKYHNKKFNDFLMTNDKSIIENIDTKVLAQYYKSLEMLDKLVVADDSNNDNSDKNKNSGTNVNINVQGNTTIKQVDNNTIEVTSDEAAGNLLKALSQFQRTREKS